MWLLFDAYVLDTEKLIEYNDIVNITLHISRRKYRTTAIPS
jgi:hypothetical protein